MTQLNIITSIHTSTKRDYLARVTEYPKAEAATRAKQWGYDYWDGDRRTGYGGYHYDGRWVPMAKEIAHHYGLSSGDSVLDVGCGKGFLASDLAGVVPGLKVYGLDISDYGLRHAHPPMEGHVVHGSAPALPFPNNTFDLVISLNVFHNLFNWELQGALTEVERVGRGRGYVVVESYRNEEEKANLLYWQLTCEQFCTPQEWSWWFELSGYTGDYEFIFFE